jgi:hypothetical protein
LRFLPCRDDDNVGNIRRRAPPKNSAAASYTAGPDAVTEIRRLVASSQGEHLLSRRR